MSHRIRVVPYTLALATSAAANNEKSPVIDDDAWSSTAYCSVTSDPSIQSTQPRRGRVRRWVSTYPRLGFMLVLILCACVTGAYSSYLLATWTVRLTGATAAQVQASLQLVAKQKTLQDINNCVSSQALVNAVDAKAEMKRSHEDWLVGVQQQRRLAKTMKQNLTARIDRGLTQFEQETSSCVEDGVRFVMGDTNSTQAVVKSYVSRLDRIVVDATRRKEQLAHSESVGSLLSVMVANTTNTTIGLLSAWLDDVKLSLREDLHGLNAGLMADRRPEGLDARGAASTLEVFAQLMRAARSSTGADKKVDHFYDDLIQPWKEIETAVTQLGEQVAAVGRDLERVRNTTEQHVVTTVAAVDRAVDDLQAAVSSELQTGLQAIVDEISRLVSVDSGGMAVNSSSRIDVDENELEAADALLPASWNATIDKVIHELKAPINSTAGDLGTHPDSANFWPSLVQTVSVLISIILALDSLHRLQWLIEKTTALFTESYLDMEPVDVRDITPITTLLDIWGIFKCRHNLIDVLYTLVTDGMYLVETAIHFMLWLGLAVSGTLGLVHWQQYLRDQCHSSTNIGLAAATPPVNAIKWLATVVDPGAAGSRVSPFKTMETLTLELEQAVEKHQRDWRSEIAATQRQLESEVEELVVLRRFLANLEGVATNCSGVVDELVLSTPTLDWRIDVSTTITDDTLSHPREWRDAISMACFPAPHGPPLSVNSGLAKLEVARDCVWNQALYLTAASWWLVLVFGLSLRMVARMVIKSLGLTWWHTLGDGRLHVIGFCTKEGEFVSSERLPKAVRRHLRNVRWRVGARMVGVVLAIAFAVAVAVMVLPSDVMQPLNL